MTYNETVEDFSANYLELNVYYESQNIEVEKTVNAYSAIALLSDIGGLLGLFLGASVISMLEFGAWLLDEFKDRCLGVNDKKLEEWYEAAEAELEAMDKQKTNTKSPLESVSERESNLNGGMRTRTSVHTSQDGVIESDRESEDVHTEA